MMSDNSCLVRARIHVCFTVEMLFVILGLVSSVSAEYVDKLEGSVELPNLHNNLCGDACPKPTVGRGSTVDFQRQRAIMNHNWRDDMPYSFGYSEAIDEYPLDWEFVGSQTTCVKRQGTYNCTLVPGEYCPGAIRLAFSVRGNVRITTLVDNGATMIPRRELYYGKSTIQIFLFGSSFNQPRANFKLLCPGTSACLRDSLTVISLQYRCVDQSYIC